MCIAILNTKQGGIIAEEYLWNAWKANNHGAGYAFSDGKKIYIYKELHSFKKFYNAYCEDRANFPDVNFMLHFRIKTHGVVNKDNCHPFYVNDKLVFCHNGIVDGFGSADKSDTVEFNEKVLRHMPENFVDFEGCRRLIRKSTGWSKFVFLKVNNEYRIINEEAGQWFEGNWYSNSTYRSCGYRDYGGKSVAVNTMNYSIDAFTESGLPVETVDEPKKKRSRKARGHKAWPEHSETVNFTDGLDDLPFEADETKDVVRSCSECYTELNGRMENHYGVCTKCLKKFEIIP